MTKIEQISELGLTDAIIFKDPDYENAIIGVTHNNRVVYDYDKMIECLMAEDSLTEEQARDWIDYNTVRSLSYSSDKGPVILYRLEEE